MQHVRPETVYAQLGSPEELNIPSNDLNGAAVDNVMSVVLFAAGVVAVISLIIGGFYYVASAGDSGRVTKAKNIILYSAAGLVVVAMAFVITQFVIGRVQG